MKRLLTILMLAAALPAWCQDAQTTIHVTSVQDHVRSNDEQHFATLLHTKHVTGTIGNKKYMLEEAATLAYPFEVGKDYPVIKVSDTGIQIRVTDKKGRQSTERLRVLGVEEVQ